MPDWAELLATGDLVTIIVVLLLVLITGGVGAAVVSAISASRRGVKGDALVKEQNGIEGLSQLTVGQSAFIDRLEKRMSAMETDFNKRLEDTEAKLSAEIDYSNLLITTLSENTIPIPPRPRRK